METKDKHRPDGPLGLYADFTFLLLERQATANMSNMLLWVERKQTYHDQE